ncbi:unnamed protein product [Mycena citricolor]|nr:unnamed protein product [Mycena citricolor]
MHRNVTNLVCLAPGNLGITPGMRVSQLMNIGFDMAAWEILVSLCNAGTLVLRGQSSAEWRATMKKADVVIGTPSMLHPHNPADYPNIKTVAVAGEACPQALADLWGRRTNFHNCCGPTEVTIVNTMHLHVLGTPLSIGKPVPNTNVYVLDDEMKPCAVGVPGIMWAGGHCVTRGYLNLPDKTREKYTEDPFTKNGSKMFNTGDMGSWREDGTLDHLGRVDDQVKIKGFRVELDGIAASMETTPNVLAAAAILIEGELWGFVTPAVEEAEVKKATARIQPYYAVPTRIMALESFPKTHNDKTDRRALKQLAVETVAQASSDGLTIVSAVGTKAESLSTKAENAESLNTKAEKAESLSTKAEFVESELWTGYEEDEVPDKVSSKFVRNVRHQVFSLYRRLFGVVFVVNVAVLVWIAVKGANSQRLGLIAISNIFCAILMRQDYVINVFFNVCCAVPPSWPLFIRRVCARVYHIGGLHSGCAMSGVVWLAFLCAQATKEVAEKRQLGASVATVAISYSILAFLVGIVIFAMPAFRSQRHDTFERIHRFCGWTGIALVWAQVVSLTNDYRGSLSLGSALLHSAPFWLLVTMTCSIILPWTRLRKVPVRSEVLSPHAVRMHFDYCTPKAGSFVRLADHPLKDWHGFATIPEPDKPGFSLVVSKAGDWTAAQICEPPSHVWVRGVPCFGVLRIAPLFRRIVLVATGSGIGPCAPVILERRIPIRLLWTSPNVRQTFGDHLVDQILEANPESVIYDTKKHGKPDMVKLTLRLVKEFDAEAVCIISNQKLTRKVVYGMVSRGIPAFGAIWDS